MTKKIRASDGWRTCPGVLLGVLDLRWQGIPDRSESLSAESRGMSRYPGVTPDHIHEAGDTALHT